jgi:hypothetical protein
MTSGDSGTAIGLVTPAAVVTHTYLDKPGDPPDELKLEQRGDDAATLVRWLFGGLAGLYGDWTGETGEDVQCMLARLSVEAGLNDRNGEDIGAAS